MTAPDAISRMRAAPACAEHLLVDGTLTAKPYCAWFWLCTCDACAAIVRDAALPEASDLTADCGSRRLMITARVERWVIAQVYEDGGVARREAHGDADIDDEVRWLTALPTEPSDAAVEAAVLARESGAHMLGSQRIADQRRRMARAMLAAAYAAERGRR